MGYSWSDECVRVVGSVDELLQLLKTLFSGGIGIDDYGTRIYLGNVYFDLSDKDNYTDDQLKKMIKESGSSLEITCETESDPMDEYLVRLLVSKFPFLELNGHATGCQCSIPVIKGYRTDKGKLYTTTFEERSIDLILRETNYLDYMFRLLPYDKFCSIFCIDKSKFSEKDLESLYTRSIDLADEVDSYEPTNEYINECFPDIGYERFIEICNYGTEIGEKKYKQIIKLIKAMGVIDPLEF